ncbi:MAG: hypothetical protein ABI316_07735 [Casimicrobiaceae bacterium]
MTIRSDTSITALDVHAHAFLSRGALAAVVSEHFLPENLPHKPNAHIAAHGSTASTSDENPAATIQPQPA